MSLITRCPACTTMFKVVPDQLRVSEGWVRCGQCHEVFDANAHLQASVPGHEFGTPAGSDRSSSLTRSVDDPTPVVQAPHSAVPSGAIHLVPGETSAPFLEVNPRALHIEHDDIRIRADGADVPTDVVQPSVAAPQHSDREESPPIPTAVHSFMRSGAQTTGWSRRWVRWLLALLSVVLTVVLALQVIVYERDRIAAVWPETVPMIEPLCAAIGCSISPYRQIESVVIDSSSFTKVRSEVYRLNFTLKNTAQTRVATPAMELTLTDTQDQAVVRRVFTPGDFAGAAHAMEVGAEINASLAISVKLPGNNEKVSGYRLLSFYP